MGPELIGDNLYLFSSVVMGVGGCWYVLGIPASGVTGILVGEWWVVVGGVCSI